MTSLRLITRRGWSGVRGGIVFTVSGNRVKLPTKFKPNESWIPPAPALNSPIFQRGFHHNSPCRAPFLFPPVVVKGAYYLARTGISLFPFVRKSNFYQKHGKTLRLLFLVPIVFGVALIVYSLDRNPITGRLTLTLNNQETETYFEIKEVEEVVKSSSLDPVSENLWKETILTITEIILDASNLVELKENLIPIFIKSEVPYLLLTTEGCLIITSEMLRLFEGEEELFAAAVSHHIAHVLCRHSAEATGMTAIYSLFMDSIRVGAYSFSFNYPFFSDIIALGLLKAQSRFLDRPFTIKLEEEANIISLHLLSRAGYDPTSVLKFWDKLETHYGPSIQEKKFDIDLILNTDIQDLLKPKEDLHSLHPNYPTRSTQLKAALPPALEILDLVRNGHPPTEPLSSCRYLKESFQLSKLSPYNI